MKKLLILFYTLIFTLNISAQMSIYFQQGEVDVKVPFVDIDSITFNPVESNYLYTQLRIHNVNNTSTDLTLADIDNIYFKDSDILNPADITTQVLISYNGNSISTTNPLAGNGVSISNTGGNVVVTSTVAGVEYILSGTTSNGSFKIYSDFEFLIFLSIVSDTPDNAAPKMPLPILNKEPPTVSLLGPLCAANDLMPSYKVSAIISP